MSKQIICDLLTAKQLVTPAIISKLDIYQKFLKSENQKMNLTSIVEIDEVYEKHFYDSLTPLFFEKLANKTVVDIGSGAGFPGLVLAIIEPTLKLTIIEASAKRINFLKQLIVLLELDNVTLINDRAEAVINDHREQYDYTIFRAVASLQIMCEVCAPFLKIGGLIIALKGPQGLIELENSSNALKVLNLASTRVEQLELPVERSQRVIIFIEKIGATNPLYPRSYGTIKKMPL